MRENMSFRPQCRFPVGFCTRECIFQSLMVTFFLFLVAILYSCVGHAGASGYVAVLTLAGWPASAIKPSSLILNLGVATVGVVQFGRAKWIPWKEVLPYVALSIPLAWLGGNLNGRLPDEVFKPLLGCVLVYAAYRLFTSPAVPALPPVPPATWKPVLAGAGIGFLSGLTSTGGGIFLSPLILLLRWQDMQRTAGLSILFIWVNSAAGLVGQVQAGAVFPSGLLAPILAVLAGGAIGSQLGSQQLPGAMLKRLLAIVLIAASFKLFSVLWIAKSG
jgi:uncharacterized protein